HMEGSMMHPAEIDFTRRMATQRRELGWSQSELARRLQEAGLTTYHQTTVSRLEQGERPVRLGEARAIAAVLGIPILENLIPSEAAFASATDQLRKAAEQLSVAAESLTPNPEGQAG